MAEKPYGERVLAMMQKHCERRGIPEPELESVLALVAQRYGKSIYDMDIPELKKVNRAIPEIFLEYLGGKKRRGDEPLAAW